MGLVFVLAVVILIAVLGVTQVVMAEGSHQHSSQEVSGELFAQAIPAPDNFVLRGNTTENLTTTTSSVLYLVVLKNPNSFPVSYKPNLTVTLSSEVTSSIVFDSQLILNTTKTLKAHGVTEVYHRAISIPENAEKGKYLFQATEGLSGKITLIGEQLVLTRVTVGRRGRTR